jgi:dephospho-CoA kinase
VFRVGLTGGIASGKSTVAALFVELGAGLVDTDAVARDLVEPGSPALAEIRREFGSDVIDAEGGLDRRRMRSLVFADPARRRALERILHPAIRSRSLELAAASGAPYVIIAVPLLVETGFAEHVDRVLVVDCPESLQLERLVQRDGVTLDEARAMLSAQVARSERVAAADDLIDNGGNLESTREQVRSLHSRYLELGRNC